MLNEERVKHMTKLAFYEAKGGSEDLQISFRHKKDYIGFNTFWSGLWLTIAYLIIVLFFGMTFLGDLLTVMTRVQMTAIIISIFGLYLILLIAYTATARNIYKRKHARAYHRVKRFKDQLLELEGMYEKEDINE